MDSAEFAVFAKVLIAGVVGYLVGWQREYVANRDAGTRTFSLVAMSSALVTALAFDVFSSDSAGRVIANIMVGVGFLGGGMILKDSGRVRGLTTAAGMWATAAVGMTVGSGRIGLGVLAALLVLLVLSANRVELAVRRRLGITVPPADASDDDPPSSADS